MKRVVHTNPFPTFAGSPANGEDDAVVITLNSEAAKDNKIVTRRLTRLALEAIKKSGLSVATAALARHTLKRIIASKFPATDPRSLAARINNILDIVLRTGIDPDRLLEFGSSRVRQLGSIAKSYRDNLRAKGLIDRAELLLVASACSPERRRLIIHGHYRARKEEVLFIDAVAGDGSVYYLPSRDDAIFTVNREWSAYLEQNGWIVDASEGPSPTRNGERLAARFAGTGVNMASVNAAAYQNIEAEVRGTLSAAKKLVGGGADIYDIAIVARDQKQYAPLVASVADEYGLPIRFGHSTPLESTAFGGFMRLLIDAVSNGFAYESTIRLVMHPFGPKMEDGGLFEARKFHISGKDKWSELCTEFNEIDLPAIASIADWTANLKGIFTAFCIREKAARRTRELIAYMTFSEALIAAELLETSRTLSFEAFASIVFGILADESVPFHSSNVGIKFDEPENITGSTFKHIFMLGMAEGIFPRMPAEDPVVDFFERKSLAEHGVTFAEAGEVARWEQLSFYFALLAGQNIVFSYPRIIDNTETVQSSFFGRLGMDKVSPAAGFPGVSSIEELRRACLRHDHDIENDPVIALARRQYQIEKRRESSAPYDEYDGVVGVPYDPGTRTWSASQLTTIGQCSFRWFAQRLLRLQPSEEMATGLDPSIRGKLYHKTLELAVTKAKDFPDIRATTLQHLDTAFADAERDPDVGLPSIPNWNVERLEQIRDLRRAVEAADFIQDGSQVVGIEEKFEDVWQGFPVIGYIDRIDSTTEGLIAIDYKTSGSVPKGAKDRYGKLSVDVQIPLYANVALRKLYPDGVYGDSTYYSLTKGTILRKEKDGDMDKLNALADDIKHLLAKGSFAVDPDDAELACTYCDFESVCRKGPRLRRKSRT